MDDTVPVPGIGGSKVVTDGIKTLIRKHENPFVIVLYYYIVTLYTKLTLLFYNGDSILLR